MSGTVQDATNKGNNTGEGKVPPHHEFCAHSSEWPNRPQVLLRFPEAFCDSPLPPGILVPTFYFASKLNRTHMVRFRRFAKLVMGGAAQNVESIKGCFSTSCRDGWDTSEPDKSRMAR